MQLTSSLLSRLRGGLRRVNGVFSAVKRPYRRATGWMSRYLPKGLYSRAILIIVTPMVLLQSVLGFVFLERHYQLVTKRLSESIVREIATLVSVLENYPQDPGFKTLSRIASEDLEFSASVMPPEPLPPPRPKPFFDLIDRNLSTELRDRIAKPFWIDTVGRSRFVEIRIQLKDHVLRVVARRSQTYASNSHIFIVWMLSTSLVLIIIAMLFLRNQIRPIERLADAAESFGKGRPNMDFRPRGAREVRRAAHAFIEMRRRIERQMEQRTVMLAGVSHDLRTILTRFRLQLAFFGESDEVQAMRKDVDEMNHMLEDYLAFAKGNADEQVEPVDIPLLFEELELSAEVAGTPLTMRFSGEPKVPLKALAFKRGLTNLIVNASRHGTKTDVSGENKDGWLTIMVDDNGPGIPEEERENVFRPFYRLDSSRNQDNSGSGLGLAIARDTARAHGGRLTLATSPMGGLRAILSVPS